MKKLILDDLQVDSFHTEGPRTARGTVAGHETGDVTCQTSCMGNSCIETACGGVWTHDIKEHTCYADCQATAGPEQSCIPTYLPLMCTMGPSWTPDLTTVENTCATVTA